MEHFKALGTGARAALLAGGALIAGATGFGIWSVNQPAVPAPVVAANEPAPAATPASAPAAEPVATAAPDSVETASESAIAPAAEATNAEPEVAEALPAAPTFDLVRVEPDGQALVAGQAAPGAKVILRLNGAEISGTTADAQGNFAVLFVLDPSPVARMLTLGSLLPGGSEVAALGEVALAPTVAASVVAAADAAGSVATEVLAEEAIEAAPAVEAPAALLVTKDGVNVLQTSDQPSLVEGIADLALDTISYTPTGEVQLAGRATAGSVLRVYLDNAPLTDIVVGENGRWASTLPMIAPGIYTLRVDALTADGKVIARFETPFKRETPEALAAAAQIEAPAAVVATVERVAKPSVVPEPLATDAQGAVAAPTVNETETVATPIAPTDQTDALQVATAAAEPAPARPVSLTVQPGFTLWGIATEQFGDGVLYVQVFEANKDKIRDPNLIYPGQVFVIPTGSE